MCLMISISLSFLPGDIAVGVATAQANQVANTGNLPASAQSLFAQLSGGGGTRAAGLIIFVFCKFASLFILATPNLVLDINFSQIIKSKPNSPTKVLISGPTPQPSPIPAKSTPVETPPVKETEIQIDQA